MPNNLHPSVSLSGSNFFRALNLYPSGSDLQAALSAVSQYQLSELTLYRRSNSTHQTIINLTVSRSQEPSQCLFTQNSSFRIFDVIRMTSNHGQVESRLSHR